MDSSVQDGPEHSGGVESVPSRARIVFLVRVPVARREEFLAAYEAIRFEVARGVPGHLVDQVCHSDSDPEQWLITSEWRSMEDFRAWELSGSHGELVRPLRTCMTEARSLRFAVRAETRGAGASPVSTPAPMPVRTLS